MGRGIGQHSAVAPNTMRQATEGILHLSKEAVHVYKQTEPLTENGFLGKVFKTEEGYSLLPEEYFDGQWWDLYEERVDKDADGWLVGWTEAHNLDPSDMTMIYYELRNHPLYKWCRQHIHDLIRTHNLPFDEFQLYLVHLDEDACEWKEEYGDKPDSFLGSYLPESGRCQAPIVYVNLDAHLDDETIYDETALKQALGQTLDHEMRHAYQDYLRLPFHEDEAENGASIIPF